MSKKVRALVSLCQVRSAMVEVISLFECLVFKISALLHACVPVGREKVALVLCHACYILGSGP